jgi:hypothetical protein
MESRALSLDVLPTDVIVLIIAQIFGVTDETSFDSSPLTIMLLILQYVNKRFYRVLSNQGSISHRFLTNLRNLPAETLKTKVLRMMRETCYYGSISLLEWCEKHTKAQMSAEWFYGAAEGADVE